MCCQEQRELGAWQLAVDMEQLLLGDPCAPRAVAGEGAVGVMVQALADVAEAAAEAVGLADMAGVVVVLEGSATVLTSLDIRQAAARSYTQEAAKQGGGVRGTISALTSQTTRQAAHRSCTPWPDQQAVFASPGPQHRCNRLLHSLQHCLLSLSGKPCGILPRLHAFSASQASAQAQERVQFSHMIWWSVAQGWLYGCQDMWHFLSHILQFEMTCQLYIRAVLMLQCFLYMSIGTAGI